MSVADVVRSAIKQTRCLGNLPLSKELITFQMGTVLLLIGRLCLLLPTLASKGPHSSHWRTVWRPKGSQEELAVPKSSEFTLPIKYGRSWASCPSLWLCVVFSVYYYMLQTYDRVQDQGRSSQWPFTGCLCRRQRSQPRDQAVALLIAVF